MSRKVFAALLCVAALCMTAAAQTAPVVLYVARVQVKPDRIGEWRDVEKQYSEAYKKGGGTFRYVYRNLIGNPYEYMVVTSMPNHAAMDEKSPYLKGAGEGELARMATRRAQCTESVRTTIEKSLPELSIPPDPQSAPKMIRITRVSVRNGMADQYIALLKDEYVPALKKGGAKSLLVRQVEFGGSRNLFTLRGTLDKWAELDQGSVIEKGIGKEGAAKLLAKLRAMSNSSEYLIYGYVPEISYRPQP